MRISNSGRSHDLIAGYAGTDTWVFGPDGDELYDPEGLRRLRDELQSGRYDEHFRLIPAMLHAVELDESAMKASGYLSPPSRCGAKLLNFAAIESWTNVHRQCLHDGDVVYRPGRKWSRCTTSARTPASTTVRSAACTPRSCGVRAATPSKGACG